MSDQRLRTQLYEAFKHRALIYHAIFEELREELGDDRAEELLSRAIYRRGAERGRRLPVFGRHMAARRRRLLLPAHRVGQTITQRGRHSDGAVGQTEMSAPRVTFPARSRPSGLSIMV